MIILVVGMHRSGTSMVARGLHAMGLHLGSPVDTEPGPGNEHGHWEHTVVWRAQERLLIDLGREWHTSPGPMPDRWLEWPDTARTMRELRAVAERELAHASHWLVKDPRTSLLIPMWREVAAQLDVPLRILHVHRDADEVAASLTSRQAMDPELAHRIWRHHQDSIERDRAGLPYTRVDHRRIMQDPFGQFAHMGRFCGLPKPDHWVMQAAVIIDGGLWHQRTTTTQPAIEPTPPSSHAPATPEPITDRGTVTIIMRTRWRRHLLPRALRSVLSQTYPHWFLQIINDGGLPGMVERDVEPYRHLLGDRLNVIHLEQQVGLEAASNVGIEATSGTFIAIHDDDDSWLPEFLERMVARLDTTGTDAAVCKSWLVHEAWNGSEYVTTERTPFGPNVDSISAEHLAEGNLFPPIALLFHRRLMQTLGPFEERLPALGDWHFNRRVASRQPIGVVPDILARWHQRDVADRAPNTHRSDHHRSHHYVRSWPNPAEIPEFFSEAREVTVFDDGEPLERFERIPVPGTMGSSLEPGLYVVRCDMPRQGRTITVLYRESESFEPRLSVTLKDSEEHRFHILINARNPIHAIAVQDATSPPQPLPHAEVIRLGDAITSLDAFSQQPRLPDVLGIGAQRSGTTWLHAALQSHPDVWSSPIKEYHHFDWHGGDDDIGAFRQRQALTIIAAHPTASTSPGRDSLIRMALRHAFPPSHGWENYASAFQTAPKDHLVCDFTPAYATLDHRAVAEITHVMPDLKVITILRDPVDRAYSGALHDLRHRQYGDVPEAAVRMACDAPQNVLRTDYVRTLDVWTEYVPPERLLVLFFDDLVHDPAGVMQRVCSFLGLRPHPEPASFLGHAIPRNETPLAWDGIRMEPVKAHLARRWLPMLRVLEERYPTPVGDWRAASERRLTGVEVPGWKTITVSDDIVRDATPSRAAIHRRFDAWKDALLREELPMFPAGGTIIEIAPGTGRTAPPGAPFAGLLICPDPSTRDPHAVRRDGSPLGVHGLHGSSVLRDLEERLAIIEQERTDASKRSDELAAALARRDAEMQAQRAVFDAHVAALTRSRSWRMTLPFRELARWFTMPRRQIKRYAAWFTRPPS